MAEPFGAILDEHAPRDNGKQAEAAATYEPTPEERKAVKLAEHLFSKGRKARAQYDDKWLDYYYMFRGRQWKAPRPSYRHAEVINLVFRTIQSTVPIQVDQRPRFEFLPTEPADMELSEILNDCAEADWHKGGWQEQLLEVVYDANLYGTGLSKTVVQNVKGKPTIVYESVDPFYFYPDPDARDVNKRCDWVVYAEPVSVKKVERQYPDKARFLKADIVDLMRATKTDLSPLKVKTPVDQRMPQDHAGVTPFIDEDKALVVTVWLTPEACCDEYDEVEKKNDDGTSVWEKRAKYPSGRKIVVCNDILLEDTANGYDDAEIPFERYVNYLLPREFWGISEVEQLEGPQKSFNKLVSFALDVLTLMGNPIWKVPFNSGVDVENLVNRPGLVVEHNVEAEPKREEGVQLQPYVLQMIDRMAQWFNDVSGNQEVSNGISPPGVTAASAINTLQEAAHTRIRQKQRNLDVYLQRVGAHYASRAFQFKSAPEVYRLTNQEGANKYFRMHVEDYDVTAEDENGVEQPTGETGRRVRVTPYGPDGEQIDQEQMYVRRGEFDVRVVTGSELPFAKAEKEQRLLNLFDRKIIDEEEVLKGIQFPNYQAVMERMAQKAQAAAQAAPPDAPPQAAG